MGGCLSDCIVLMRPKCKYSDNYDDWNYYCGNDDDKKYNRMFLNKVPYYKKYPTINTNRRKCK